MRYRLTWIILVRTLIVTSPPAKKSPNIRRRGKEKSMTLAVSEPINGNIMITLATSAAFISFDVDSYLTSSFTDVYLMISLPRMGVRQIFVWCKKLYIMITLAASAAFISFYVAAYLRSSLTDVYLIISLPHMVGRQTFVWCKKLYMQWKCSCCNYYNREYSSSSLVICHRQVPQKPDMCDEKFVGSLLINICGSLTNKKHALCAMYVVESGRMRFVCGDWMLSGTISSDFLLHSASLLLLSHSSAASKCYCCSGDNSLSFCCREGIISLDLALYVNGKSNYLGQILENIPLSINLRLTELWSTANCFDPIATHFGLHNFVC